MVIPKILRHKNIWHMEIQELLTAQKKLEIDSICFFINAIAISFIAAGIYAYVSEHSAMCLMFAVIVMVLGMIKIDQLQNLVDLVIYEKIKYEKEQRFQ